MNFLNSLPVGACHPYLDVAAVPAIETAQASDLCISSPVAPATYLCKTVPAKAIDAYDGPSPVHESHHHPGDVDDGDADDDDGDSIAHGSHRVSATTSPQL